MLPGEYRLKRSKEFVRVRRFGRSAGSPLVALYVLQVRTPALRAGFSVSKRVGKATVRNRVKRLLREAVRSLLPALRANLNLVFIARPAAAGASYQQIADAVVSVLQRTGAFSRSTPGVHNA